MKRHEQDRLLKEILAGEEMSEFRRASLDQKSSWLVAGIVPGLERLADHHERAVDEDTVNGKVSAAESLQMPCR